MSLFTTIFGTREVPPEVRSTVGINDPEIPMWCFGGAPSLTGVAVNEKSALGVSAVWRAVSLIAGSIAMLPLHAVSVEGGVSQPVDSLLDSPGFNMTKLELIETTMAHLLLHGNAFLAHVYSNAGGLMALQPIHPTLVSPSWDRNGNVTYRVAVDNGSLNLSGSEMTHIKGLSLDGRVGLSPLTLARNGMFGTSISADNSAATMFRNGALVSAIVTPEDDLTPEQADQVKEFLTQRVSGQTNAGDIAVINRKLKITPWSLSNEDAQWLQSRSFQVEEVARWFGIPAVLIGQSDKQSSWGAGVDVLLRGHSKFTLQPWTTRIEEKLSLLLPSGTTAQFNYHEMIAPDPEAETGLAIQKVRAGLITPNEARRVWNMPPLDGGDTLQIPAPTSPAVHNEGE